MKIADVTQFLDSIAPPDLQESYDNGGLLTGRADADCKGILCTLDVTEAVVGEAVQKGCNLIVAHHPIIFKGLKKINGNNHVERTVIAAIKNDIAIFALHTALDNILEGVNKKMADLLELTNRAVLTQKDGTLCKLYTYVPMAFLNKVRDSLFLAGAGNIGAYSECSYSVEGEGTFKAGEGTQPFVGEQGTRHYEKEAKLEVIIPSTSKSRVIKALLEAHPYEEVAYEIIALENRHAGIGSGLIGDLPDALSSQEFLAKLKKVFGTGVIRHTKGGNHPIKRVALCGGAGSFLISKALALGANTYVTADLKYHEFFDAEERLLLCDIGHYESEQFTVDLFYERLRQKFTNFAVLKTGQVTNPVLYYT
jgi:dinuclear metal center YbgI/SA1388 family protein